MAKVKSDFKYEVHIVDSLLWEYVCLRDLLISLLKTWSTCFGGEATDEGKVKSTGVVTL